MLRHVLYEVANSHLRIAKKWSVLRAWGVTLAGAFAVSFAEGVHQPSRHRVRTSRR